jgi:hypothetical protein
MTAAGAAEELLRALTQRDAAAAVSALGGGQLEIVPLGVSGAAAEVGAQYFGDLFASFPELEVSVVRTVDAGEKALLELVLTGAPKQPYLDLAVKDGKRLTSRQAWKLSTGADGVSATVFFCLNEVKWSLGANKSYEEAIAGSA